MKDSSLSSILIESVLSLEKNLGNIELKINTIFSTINSLLEFSSSNGKNSIEVREIIKELKDNLVYKEDLVEQFSSIHGRIELLSALLTEKSTEMTALILGLTNRLENIEEILANLSSQDSSKNKRLFK